MERGGLGERMPALRTPFVHFCLSNLLIASCTISSETSILVRDEDILARALSSLNLASMNQCTGTLKPEQESVVRAFGIGRAVYNSFSCRIQEKSNFTFE